MSGVRSEAPGWTVADAQDDTPEARLVRWRTELDATPDRAQRAIILYEIANLLEKSGDVHGALEQLKASITASRAFRPSMFALIRLLERVRSFDALADLYAIEARAAKNAAEEVSAMLDHASLFENHLRRPKDARALYERALARDPSSQAAALMFEAFMRRNGDRRAAARAVATRAQQVKEPVLRRVLFIESALAREEEGDIDGAAEFLRTIAQNPLERWRVLHELERIARKHRRPSDLLYAIEQQAVMASTYAEGDDAQQRLVSGSLAPFGTEQAAHDRAIALFHDLSLLKSQNADHGGAIEAIERAITLGPDDLYLAFLRVELLERAGRMEDAIESGGQLAEKSGAGSHRAALHLWIADMWGTQSLAKPARRSNEILAALRADPTSPAIHTVLHEERRASGEYETLITALEARAASQKDRAARTRLLWRAAQMAVDELGDLQRGVALYRAAAELAPESPTILRELHGAVLFADVQQSLDIADELVTRVSADERDVLLHGQYLDMRSSPQRADHFLRAALASSDQHPWVASTARIRAAKEGNFAMLAEAHRVLAGRVSGDESIAHLCCAARALGRNGQLEEAVLVARSAVEGAPGHAYAITLLEELLRAQNDVPSVVALLREAASRTESEREAELLLLRAVAAAEMAGGNDLALETCREAALRSNSLSTAWTLLRLASARGNSAIRLEALETLARRETAAGQAGSVALALAEHDDLTVGRPEEATQGFLRVLDEKVLGLAAAAALLVRPADAPIHLRALERLAAEADGPVSIGLHRARAALLLERTSSEPGSDHTRIFDAVLQGAPQDRWARYALFRLRRTKQEGGRGRAVALAALAKSTSDAETGAELLLHAKWIAALDPTQATEGRNEASLHAIESAAPRTLLAAVALDESWAEPRNASATADALVARIPHTSDAVKAPLEAALGRALTLAGRPEQATRTLRSVVTAEPEDLASWEALRVAARECGDWGSLVDACGRLAQLCHGNERAELLEELGVWLLDMNAHAPGAEGHLRAALDIDATLPAAYARLHELLTVRNEQPALLDVISARIRALEADHSGADPEELATLLYEEGQLRFALGDFHRAIESLHKLRDREPSHAAALALLAQAHTRLHQWDAAAEALDAVAAGQAPDAIRKLAGFAGAEIRTAMLRDARGAYEQLRAVEGTAPVSSELYARMADAAEDAGLHDDAATALTKAAAMSSGGERARYQRRLARLYAQRLGNERGAIDAYRRALAERPTDVDAAEELAKILPESDRRELLSQVERSVLIELGSHPTEPQLLRVLARLGAAAESPERIRTALSALDALGAATDAERETLDATARPDTSVPKEGLDADDFDVLLTEGSRGRLAQTVSMAEEALIEAEGMLPERYGVGRSALVKPRDQTQLHDELQAIAAAFGLTTHRIYAGGSLEDRILLLPQGDDKVTFVVGNAVDAALGPAERFDVGRQCMAARMGTTFLGSRTVEDGPGALACIVQAAGAPLEPDLAPNSTELVEGVRKHLSRRARKDIVALFQNSPLGMNEADAFFRGADEAAMRAGLLLCGDLPTALDAASGDDALRRSLLRFWVSPELRALRRRFTGSSSSGLASQAPRAAAKSSPAAAHLEIVSDEDHEGSRRRAVDKVLQQLRAAIAPAYQRSHTLASAVPRAAGRTAEDAMRHRIAVLGQLERATIRNYKARALVAVAELCEQLGDDAGARDAYARAREADPRDVVALRRTRRDALRRAAWQDAIALIEAEASLSVKPEERAFALGLAAAIHAERLDDAVAAESAAYRALMIRPQSAATALLLAQAQLANGKTKEAQLTLERASGTWKDAAGGAALLMEIARDAEREGDFRRARMLYKRAAELDPRAVDALLGVARSARPLGELDDAIEATRRIAQLTEDRRLADAFLRAGARLAHLGAHRPHDAFALLAHTDDIVAVDAKIEAAEVIGDRGAMRDGLAALAGATRRTERALALARLAEIELGAGNLASAQNALREAVNADASLVSIRVLDEQLARRAGDLRRLTRVGGTTSQDALVSAARTALHPEAAELEKRLLMQAASASHANVVTGMLLLDAATHANDEDAVALAHRSAGERAKAMNDPGPVFAAVESLVDQGRIDEAMETLQEARRAAPNDVLGLRWIMRLVAQYPAHDLAAFWLEEAAVLEGERAAFAACRAARLLERSGGDASQAYLLALEKQSDYAPALWALAHYATRTEDAGLLRETLMKAADNAASPEEAAEALVRAALHTPTDRQTLFARAQALTPQDTSLLMLRLRSGTELDAAERAALFEGGAHDGATAWSRVLRLRAATEYESAGRFGHAANVARSVATVDHGDVLAAHILDRCERHGGDHARVRERYTREAQKAHDAASKAIAFERLATYEVESASDVATCAEPLQRILEHYPTHIATLRTLERFFMHAGSTAALAGIEERFARLGDPNDAAAHARFAAKLALASENATGMEADEILRSAFDHVKVDAWLARQVEGVARATGDVRLLVQALEEAAAFVDDPFERTALELRLCESIAEIRSPAGTVGRLEEAVATAVYPLAWEQLARLQETAAVPIAAAEAYLAAAETARSTTRIATLAYRAGILFRRSSNTPERAAEAFTKAADALEKASRLTQAPIARRALLLELQRVCTDLGDQKRAEAALQHVLRLFPGDAEAGQRLAALRSI